ncbi:MAG: carboxypeptidase regulatory-like domain-containing protein [Planctomycetaceae bacterium]|nr:carboxypeptidase regulatory-like domain-containing protein [Planctomycetaceae bacterium]
MSQFHRNYLLSLVFTSLFLPCLGCGGSSGPDLGKVDGTVTVDGAPIEGATVTFQPASGRPSMGITTADGKYSLMYTSEQYGAIPGTHTVSIRTARDQTGGEGDQPLVEGRAELLPAKYHDESELTAEVSKGSNTLNFDLTTK